MNLVILTEQYPSLRGEEFLETEIPFLAARFESIVIIPRNGDFKITRKLPLNASIDASLSTKIRSKRHRLSVILTRPFLVLSLLIKDIAVNKKIGSFGYKQIRRRIIVLAEALLARRALLKYRGRPVVFYSYWGNASALGLAVMKKRKELDDFVVRLHGYDLYDERYDSGGVPFRNFIVSYARVVACIAETGKRYLEKKGSYRNLIVSRLGVHDNGSNPKREASSDALRILSCSSVIPIKRVHLIVEILKYIEIQVEWIHLGDGPGLHSLKQAAAKLGRNVSVEFPGHLPNNEVLDLYRTKHIDVLIHMSETEGIPVSFMEAISFGVPIISTNVGGVAELVNEQTGILIDPIVNIKYVAEILNTFSKSQYMSEGYRKKIKDFWQDNFKAEANYESFLNQVLLH